MQFECVKTGFDGLDEMLGGGLPVSKAVEIYGEEGAKLKLEKELNTKKEKSKNGWKHPSKGKKLEDIVGVEKSIIIKNKLKESMEFCDNINEQLPKTSSKMRFIPFQR